MKLIDKNALIAEIEKSVKLMFENNDRIYDAYGNYFYKNAENDYRFYHKLDEDNWDEDRLTLTDVVEYLFHLNTLEIKEVDLDEEISTYMNIHHLKIKDGGRIVFNNGDTPNFPCDFRDIAKHFFELGLKAQKGE